MNLGGYNGRTIALWRNELHSILWQFVGKDGAPDGNYLLHPLLCKKWRLHIRFVDNGLDRT